MDTIGCEAGCDSYQYLITITCMRCAQGVNLRLCAEHLEDPGPLLTYKHKCITSSVEEHPAVRDGLRLIMRHRQDVHQTTNLETFFDCVSCGVLEARYHRLRRMASDQSK